MLPAPTTAPEPMETPDKNEGACTDPDVVANGDRHWRRARYSFDDQIVAVPSRIMFRGMAQSLPMEMCSKQLAVESQLM